MMNKNIDKIGELKDDIDNLIATMEMPLYPKMQLEQTRIELKRISDELRNAYLGLSGEDPWEM